MVMWQDYDNRKGPVTSRANSKKSGDALSAISLTSLSHIAMMLSRGYLRTLTRVQKWRSLRTAEPGPLRVEAMVGKPGNGQLVDAALNSNIPVHFLVFGLIY